jgi:glutamate---cysteine ligase / carboxylate-amine ligase
VTADEIRAVFDAPEALTVGLEEEAMLLDPGTLDLAPVAEAVVAAADGAVKRELPAAQVEIATAPARDVPEAVAALAAGRRALTAAAEGVARPAVAGVHPFAAPLGELSTGPRYDKILGDYGDVARAQQVCALQVHVAVGSADGTLAVYNALRGHLPELAALAANAPFHGGRDTGLASVRPLIGGLLPRQGVPPAIPSWEAFAETLRWGRASGAVPEGRRWWWELRPHVAFGTLELRVPDAQSTVEHVAAVAAFAHSLVAWLAERHAAGEPLGAPEDWRIAENRWIACRHGLDGRLADLVTGERRPLRDVLHARLDELAPVAERLGCAAELAGAHALAERNGAAAQREIAAEAGLRGLAAWLADSF